MLQSIGRVEIIIVAVIILVLFGGKKFPELGRGLGEVFRELKKALRPKDENKEE